MATIAALVLDGTVTLIALAVLGVELLVLLLWAGRRAPVISLVANTLSGVFLILALRAALLDSGAWAIAAFLSLGFIAHLGDVLSRLRP